MTKKAIDSLECPICHEQKLVTELLPGELVHDPIIKAIKKDYPEWSEQGPICLSCLNHIRSKYVQDILEAEKGELSLLDKEVIRNLKEQNLLARNVNDVFEDQKTLGERIADKVAEFGGSWKFLGIFAGVIVVWIIINSITLLVKHFDPYPFILLNLLLSCLAAVQAPIIMMSQNRQAKKDRILSDHDYRVNLKAELEIRELNWKVDQLLTHHWQRLLDIQRIQTEMMEEISSKSK